MTGGRHSTYDLQRNTRSTTEQQRNKKKDTIGRHPHWKVFNEHDIHGRQYILVNVAGRTSKIQKKKKIRKYGYYYNQTGAHARKNHTIT
jgi:hypothetical protein